MEITKDGGRTLAIQCVFPQADEAVEGEAQQYGRRRPTHGVLAVLHQGGHWVLAPRGSLGTCTKVVTGVLAPRGVTGVLAPRGSMGTCTKRVTGVLAPRGSLGTCTKRVTGVLAPRGSLGTCTKRVTGVLAPRGSLGYFYWTVITKVLVWNRELSNT